MSNPVQFLNNFEKLGLIRMREYFPNYQDVVNSEATPFTVYYILELTNRELAFRSNRKVERAVGNVRFPFIRSLKDFDFYFQPSITRQKILDFQHMVFLEKAENIIFIGNSGVGKTHLSTALGVEACHQGIKSIFINCHELIQKAPVGLWKRDT